MTHAEEQPEHAFRESTEQSMLPAEVELREERLAVTHLSELTARLFTSTGLQPMIEEALQATISLQGADFGLVQLYNSATGGLEIAAQHGFSQEFLEHFRDCHDASAVCGRALGCRQRVVVEDTWWDAAFAPHRAIADRAGFRAVQSTPLFTRSGAPLGVLSTHFRVPRHPGERGLRFTDFYARIVAELIERHRTEEALLMSEERFRRYFNQGLIGMAITSVAKACLEVNDELCRMLGYERDELLQRNWAELTHPQDLAADLLQFDRVLAGEIDGYSLDKRWIRKNGGVIHSVMATQCVRRPDRTVDYFVALVLDTTERQRAKDELAQSEQRFRMLIESIPHHVWSVRPDGSVGYWNQRLMDYSGLRPEDLRSGNSPILQHPDDVKRVRAEWQMTLALGTSFETEQRLRGTDGRYRRFVSLATCVKNANGQPIEWLGTNTDVEDRRQAEDSLHELQAQLNRVAHETTLEEIAASIAHEINQPLAAAIANGHACVRWLTREAPAVREAAAAANRIVNDVKRAAEVIARIRAFLRRETAQATHTNVQEVIAEVIAIVQGELSSQDIALQIEVEDGLPAAAADRVQLQQVVLNLVRNALDAMVTVTQRARTLRIEMHRHDPLLLRVAVSDSGFGLPPDQRDLVFDAFHTNKPNGLGMGLAISRSIIEAHGGRLWVTANHNHGETFQFTLPIAV